MKKLPPDTETGFPIVNALNGNLSVVSNICSIYSIDKHNSIVRYTRHTLFENYYTPNHIQKCRPLRVGIFECDLVTVTL